jgi:hypothetical protein
VHDADHLVVTQRADQQVRVEDAALDERHVVGDEAAVTAGQVVEHDRVQADLTERPRDVGADVARASRHQPAHRSVPPGRLGRRHPTLATVAGAPRAVGACM